MTEDPAPKPSASQFPKNGRNDSAAFPPNPKGALEKNKLDNFLEKYAYRIVLGFGFMGVVVLLASYLFDNEELKRDVYYFFIFVGAVLAATLATWRGRQSERQIDQSDRQIKNSQLESVQQIHQFEQQMKNSQFESEQQIHQFEQQIEDSRLERQNSRFERALDMATDQKSRARRAVGFRILGQMLSSWRENFDDAIKRNIEILNYLVFNSLSRTGKQEEAFKELYKNSKRSFGADEKKSSVRLFKQTYKPDINSKALILWKGIVDWRRREGGDPAGLGVYTAKTTPNRTHRFIFSGVNLKNLQFFVRDRGKITSCNQHARADFKGSCFLLVDICGATVDYVDFTKSHFYKMNLEEKIKENCKMSCVGTIFDFANLIKCNFRDANFKGASFVGITTFEVIFDKANLTDCKFEGADLEGASFIGTNISGSDFRQAKNLTKEQFLQGAYWITQARPKFPSSFPPNFADDLPNKPPTADEIREWERLAELSP